MKIILILVFFINILVAQKITISDIYIDKENYGLETIKEKKLFQPYNKSNINLGYLPDTILMKFILTNDSNKNIQKVLVLSDPRFDNVQLYDEQSLVYYDNRFLKDNPKVTLPYFILDLEPKSKKNYYLQVNTKYSNLNFSIKIQKEKDFIQDDIKKQYIIIFFIGILIAFIFYGIMLYIYVKKSSYIFYSLYLLVFIYHQAWYLGLSYIYLSQELSLLYSKTMIIQVSALIITFALFVITFLQLDKFSILKKIYKIIIYISIFEAIFPIFIDSYSPVIVVVTGTIFIIFNNIIGIILYLKGNKEAKYFVVGYAIASIAFFIIILDYLGFTTITQDYPYVILIATTIEALIFLLAFFNQHKSLQNEYIKSELIKKEVELHKLHITEIHHRVKNNLEMILSLIDMQNSSEKDSSKFIELKNRIFAIAQTYNMLSNSGKDMIDMKSYIHQLIRSISQTIEKSKYIDIVINIDDDIQFAITKSIYIGLIINELVVNSFKYAFNQQGGTLKISLQRYNNKFILTVEDNGKGFDIKDNSHNSFGLMIVKRMVLSDLKGDIISCSKNHTKHIIRFENE